MTGPTRDHLNRVCRELVTAVATSDHPDPLDDPAVTATLRTIRDQRIPAQAVRMLAAMNQFAIDRIRIQHGSLAARAPAIGAIREDMVTRGDIDANLVGDALFIVEHPTDQTRLNESLRTWGPYLLATLSIVYIRSARTVANALPGTTTAAVLQDWALADERTLARQRQRRPRPVT